MTTETMAHTVALPGSAPLPGRARGTARAWGAFAVRRALSLLGTVAALVVITFAIIQLIPGNPAVAIAGEDATPAQVAAVGKELGLDRPLPSQFVDYVVHLAQGDLGTSFMYRQPVVDIVASRMPFTATIAGIGIALALLLAVPIGMAVGVLTRGGRRRPLDVAFGFGTGLVDSVPGYVLASLLLALFGVGVGALAWFPPAYTPDSPWLSLVLPIAALVVGPICTISRVVRRETAVVLEHDYLRTARGWRLSPTRLYLRHALPNLLTSTLTLSGLILSGMLGGALVIESVFALPGLGSGIIKAIVDRDFPLIQGMVLVIGLIAALVNLLVDVVLGLVDPRTLGGRHVGDL